MLVIAPFSELDDVRVSWDFCSAIGAINFQRVESYQTCQIMEFYIARSGKETGPFTKEQISQMLDSGMVALTDSLWHEGLNGWIPVQQFLGVRTPTPIPTQPMQADVVADEQETTLKPVNPIPALILMAASTGIYLIYAGLHQRGNQAAGYFALIFLPLYIAKLILWSLLHYRCWRAIPPQYRSTTPGRAIGFLFIPVFNFYWAFVSWPKLAEALVKCHPKWDQHKARILKNEAICCAAMFIASVFAYYSEDVFPMTIINVFGVVCLWRFYVTASELANNLMSIPE